MGTFQLEEAPTPYVPPARPEPEAEEQFPPKEVPYYLGDERRTIQLPDVQVPTFEPPKPKSRTFQLEEAPTPVPAKVEAPVAEPGFGSSYGVVRGAVQGLGGTVGSWGGTLDVFNTLAQDSAPDSTVAKLAKELHAAQQKIGTGYERQEPSIADVGGIGEAWTYAMESLGQGLGSMVAPLVGGIAGAAVGNVPGAIVGAGATGIFGGVGDMNNALLEDKGVKEALASGSISKKQAAMIALLGGGAIGALDSFGAFKASGLGKEVIQAELTKRVVQGIREGIFEEGGTEALQEVISQTLQGVTGGNADLVNRAISVVDATFGGILGGGTVGGVSGALRAPPATVTPPPPPPGTQGQPQGGQPAGAQGGPAGPGGAPGGGTSTPGGLGAGTAPQPAQTAGQGATPGTTVLTPAPATSNVTVVGIGGVPADQQAAITGVTAGQPPVTKPAKVEWVDTPRGKMPKPVPPGLDPNVPPVYPLGRPPGAPPAPSTTPYLDKTDEQRAAERTARRDELDAARDQYMREHPEQFPPLETYEKPITPTPSGVETIEEEIDEDEGVIPDAPESYIDAETGQEIVDKDELRARAEIDALISGSASGIGEKQAGFLDNLLAQAAGAARTVVAKPGEDLAAAVNAGSTPSTPQGEVPAPDQPVQQAPSGGIVPLPAAQQPATSTEVRQESTPRPLTPAPAGTLPTPTAQTPVLEGEILPRAPAPVVQQAPPLPPVKDANRKALARGIADTVRQTIGAITAESQDIGDEIFSSPDTDAIVDAVAQEMALRMPPGTAPMAYAREAAPAAVEMVRQYLHQVEEVRARQVEEEVERKTREAQEVEEHRRTKGKPEERARFRKKGKKAVEQEAESDWSLSRAYKKNPEDPHLKKWALARKQREAATRRVGRRSDKAVLEVIAEPYTQRMEEAKRERIEKTKAREELEKAARQVPAVRKAPKPGQTAREAKREQAGPTPADQAVTAVVQEFPEFQFQGLNSQNAILEAGKRYAQALKSALKKAFVAAGGVVPERIDFEQSSWSGNFVRFIYNAASTKSGSNESGYTSVSDIWLAMDAVKTGNTDGLKALISSDLIANKASLEMLDTTAQAEKTANDQGMGPLISEWKTREAPPAPEVNPKLEMPEQPGETRRETGAKALRDAMAAAKGMLGPLQRVLAVMQGKRLVELVGDIDVIFMDPRAIRKMREEQGKEDLNPRGIFISPTGRTRNVAGMRPYIVIDATYAAIAPELDVLHTIMHEMTHAATDYALVHDLHGTQKIVERMRASMEQQLKDRGIWDALPESSRYAFKDVFEFVAESFSNREFQELLTQLQVPLDIRYDIGFLPEGKPPTWWDVFLRAIANAIRLFDRKSPRGVSYLDQMIRVHPVIMQSSAQQEAGFRHQYHAEQALKLMAKREPKRPSRKPPRRDSFDLEYISHDMANIFDGMKSKMKNATYNVSAWNIWNKWASGDELKRRVGDILGTMQNAFSELMDIHVGTGEVKKRLREKGDLILDDLSRYIDRNPMGAEALSDSMHDSSVHQVDPRKSAAAQKISKTGARDEARRRALPVEVAKYNALDQEAKALFDRVADHYTDLLNEQQKLTVEAIASNIARFPSVTLPAGEDASTIAQWVLNGDIDRGPANQTQRDKDLHKALGKSVKTLKDAKTLRKTKGLYVPFTRQGAYMMTARQPIAPPAGSLGQSQTQHGLEIVFKDRKDVDAFVASHQGSGGVITGIAPIWIDPLTGKTTQKQATYVTNAGVVVNPEQRFVVTAQDRVVEMGDSTHELEQLRKGYEAQGYTTSDVIEKDSLTNARSPVLPGHVAAMLNSVNQLPHSSAIKSAASNAIVMSYARTLVGTRVQQRKLPRMTVHGFSRDLLKSLYIMNGVFAGNLASLKQSPRVQELREELEQDLHTRRHFGKGGLDSMKYQRMIKELLFRMDNTSTAVGEANEGVHGTAIKNIMDGSFMTHLMTLSYSILNATQMHTMGWPVLAGHFKDSLGAMGAINRALWHFGLKRGIYFKGLYETGRVAKGLFTKYPTRPRNYFDDVRADAAGMQFGPANTLALDKLRSLGYWASAGLELPEIGEIGRTWLGKRLERSVAVARQLPEAIEVVARAGMIVASVEMAKRRGMSDQDAADLAVNLTVQSQGGYAAENNPVFMSNKYLKVPLQFKKYQMLYGQLYVKAFYEMGFGRDPETRKAARGMVVRLSLMTAAFAGVTGLPFMELWKMWAVVASQLGDADDWDETENAIQEWFESALKVALGEDTSEAAAEAIVRGAPRLFNIDLHQRMANHLLTFGEPRGEHKNDFKGWLFDMATGAPSGMGSDVFEAYSKGDWYNIPPWPKFIKDIMKAYELYNEGTVGPEGQQYAEPIGLGEAIGQGLGFKPASSARQWEPGGSATLSKQKGETTTERQKLMARWRSQETGADKGEFFRNEIRDKWNREHKNPRDRIDMGDLQKSIRTQKQRERERKKEMAQ